MADSSFEPEVSRSLRRIACSFGAPMESIAIECKRESGKSIAFSRINNDQVEALLAFERKPFHMKMRVAASVGGKSRFKSKTGFDFLYCGRGKGFVLVNFRATKKAAGEAINRCFAVRIGAFVTAEESTERKSLPLDWFVENAVELERIRWKIKDKFVYGWDLLPLFTLPN